MWSPDSTKIAYSCDFSLCVINADGTGKRKLEDAPGGSLAFDPKQL